MKHLRKISEAFGDTFSQIDSFVTEVDSCSEVLFDYLDDIDIKPYMILS